MSSKNKNTQLLVVGLVAAVSVSLILYYSSKSSSTAKEPTKKKKLDDDAAASKGSGSRSIDLTPKKSNRTDTTDEKEMHAKIEELDKKGKALFKNKQVRSLLVVASK